MGTISVSHLGKAYKQYPSRWSRLAEWLIPFYPKRHALKWILQDIEFTVRPGEALGIIGINGAGKSTLLKMITGTTTPTTGQVRMTGRVAAMLELGMGFHPDFTGRQNAFMAGQLLGYSPDEIQQLMPEIESFAEIGSYIDEPVRVYSSGMQMRLAFSVATAIRPEILIVDEALSVGDTYFVHKSFDRIRKFREQGTTLLIVSHDTGAIKTICDRAILLNAGRIELEGKPQEVMDYYHAINLSKIDKVTTKDKKTTPLKPQSTHGTGEVTIEKVSITNTKGELTDLINVGESMTISIHLRANKDIDSLVIGYGIRDRLGQVVYGTNTHLNGNQVLTVKANQKIELSARFDANLGPGTYSIQASAMDLDETTIYRNYEWQDLALVFTVTNSDFEKFIGVAWLNPTMTISNI